MPIGSPQSAFDSLADSTSVFQTAIASLSSGKGGGSIYVPGGIYKVRQIVLPSNVRIVGDGQGISILRQRPRTSAEPVVNTPPMVTSAGFATGSTALGPSRFGLVGLTLDGSPSNTEVPNEFGGVALYGFDFTLKDLMITGFVGNGLWTEWGGKLAEDNVYLREPATFEDVSLTRNGRCGWVHLGPQDSVATRIMAWNNGREFSNGLPLNNTGEANIWLARRIAPVAYLERTGTSPNFAYRVSTPGSGYTSGIFALLKSSNNIGVLGFVKVENGKAVGIDWLYSRCVFDNMTAGTFEAVQFTGILPQGAVLPTARVKIGPDRRIELTEMTSGGAGLPEWPKILVKNDGAVPPTPVVAHPMLRGGQIHAAVILDAGNGYTGNVTVEVSQGANTSAIGVGVKGTGADAATVGSILFGSPGCFMKTVKLRYQHPTTPTTVSAEIQATASPKFGEVLAWGAPTIVGAPAHGVRLDFVPAESTPTKLAPMSGGTLLSQAHTWGAQTYGIRVSAPAVLTGCEAEGAYGANMFLEATSGTVQGAWLYDSGDYAKSTDGSFGKGSPYAVGIQIGHAGAVDLPYISDYNYNSPSHWNISGRVEQCHLGSVVSFANGDALQMDVTATTRCGIFHYGFTTFYLGSAAEALSKVSHDYDDVRLACFFGEGNFYRYARASRASISTSRFVQSNFTADTQYKLNLRASSIYLQSGGTTLAEWQKSADLDGTRFYAFNVANRGVFLNREKNGYLGADAFNFRNYLFLSDSRALTPADFCSFARFEGPSGKTITLPDLNDMPAHCYFNIYNDGTEAVTLAAFAGQTILGAATFVLAGKSGVALLSSNTTPREWMRQG